MICNTQKNDGILLKGFFCLCLLIVAVIWVHTINQPLLDLFSFRQCQTAMSSQWMNIGGGWEAIWNYKTPEFGVPWSIPFEFPLYQFVVTLSSSSLHTALDPTGRTISCLFFFGAIALAMRFLKQLGLPREVVLGFSILSICSPLYIYWSRTFMIESCAVFFGFLMLVSMQEYCLKRNFYWLGLMMMSSILCGLVKVTTWPSFVIVAFLIIFLLNYKTTRPSLQNAFVFLAILIALPVVLIWTHHADTVKTANLMSSYLTSKSLGVWNYGTLTQRCSYHLWVDVICKRAIPHILGSFGMVLCIMIGFKFSDSRNRNLLLIFIAGFLLPILLFTNLHIIHTYYQYANGLWLLIALAISVSMISKRLPHHAFAIIILGIACIELHKFYGVYWPEMIKSHDKDNTLLTARVIDSKTPQESSILIIGDDWSPELAYYSRRRAIYLPNWLKPDQVQDAFSNLTKLSGAYPVSAVVYQRNNPSSHKLIESTSNIKLWAKNEGEHSNCGNYDIYFLNKKTSSNN
jgi:Dolichyl-phosphate-mannose-protein mannosyltransferase